ncbi:MAG: MarR family transcriptional regulator [Lapillicoccus sp.]
MTSPEEPDLGPDLVNASFVRPLIRLLDTFDREIVALYDAVGVPGFRSRYAGPLIQLGRRGALTVRELADSAEVTHSAMSQTVSAMRRDGFVEDAGSGRDARTRRVGLTGRARELLPFLEAEWRATEATWLQLDAELPHPLSEVVTQLSRRVEAEPWGERLRANLDHFLARP